MTQPTQREQWIARQLAAAPALKQEQVAALKRLLTPIRRSA